MIYVSDKKRTEIPLWQKIYKPYIYRVQERHPDSRVLKEGDMAES